MKIVIYLNSGWQFKLQGPKTGDHISGNAGILDLFYLNFISFCIHVQTNRVIYTKEHVNYIYKMGFRVAVL